MASDLREFGTWLEPYRNVLVPGTRVVELGCGMGSDARYLATLGLDVIAMDLSHSRVERAARKVPDARFLVGDLSKGLPFASSVAGLVVASLSLHYFDSDTTRSIVGDISRILVPGGRLLCRVNVVGDRVSRWGEGVELETDFFEVQPGLFKRFFTEESLTDTLLGHFSVESLVRQRTTVHHGSIKETLVSQARRSN